MAPKEIPGIEDLLKSGMLKRGSSETLNIRRLPLGVPVLDNMLGGGMPLGRCLQAYGPESTGKTLMCQLAASAVQKSQHPLALYMDMEYSYDEGWWEQSGVDTDKLLVSSPTTAEQAIDVMRGVLNSTKDLGIIIVDSLAAMIPQQEMDMEKSSEDSRQPGLQAKVLTYMYHQVIPLLDNRVIFMSTNQMRETIGGHDDLAALPGGRANRHYNHIVLRTRRESWITHGNDRLGFYMEIVNRKNKMATTPDGESVTIPFMFASQIDWTTSFIDEAIQKKIIQRRGPYYYWHEKAHMGIAQLREFFLANELDFDELKEKLASPTA